MYIEEIYSDSRERKIIALCSNHVSVALLRDYFVDFALTGDLIAQVTSSLTWNNSSL